MTRYSKPVWQMVEEVVDKLGEITAKDARDYIRKNYAEDKVNESTISAQVIACSVNHPSAHHYPNSHRFLFYLGNGRYRRYDPKKDGLWEITSNSAQKIIREVKTEQAYFSQIDSNGQVRLPKEIQEKLSIGARDFVAFVTDEQGNIILKKAELRPV
ncbi:MAG: hypothetical protein AOA66_0978 [Candidatus Bathyarchaeota archaeon BA2]|nr:MAG: hypothetical protein AOA66_0978 [Candidatus Bathyarchaeota archaeon BA2]